jgi:hypothetical protein
MKNLVATLLLLLPGLLLAQIGAKVQQSKIHGTWKAQLAGIEMTLVLNADGTGSFDGDKIRYTAQNGKINLTIISESETLVYDYILQGNSLIVSGGDLEEKVTFTRSGLGVDNAAKPTATSISIVGVWSGNNETIEFTKESKCLYQGQTFQYQVTGNQITVQTPQGNLVMPYAVSGNNLSLTINGQIFNYTKNGAVQSNTNAQVSGKHVAPELVGKWCYVNVNSTNSGGSSTEQCITLQADGTYEYYSESSRSVNTNAYSGGTNSQDSDRGTWSYDGSRIHYTSTMGNGSGSYLLEKRNHPKNNDPMIVLDGQTYVTQYQKAPWR